MLNRRTSIESGFGSEASIGSSAVKNFFNDFVSKLGSAVQKNRSDLCIGYDMEVEDPTIDLGCIDKGVVAICPPSPIPHSSNNRSQRGLSAQKMGVNNTSKVNNTFQREKPLTSVNQQLINKPKTSHRTFQVSPKRDPSLSELRVIVGQIKDNSSYSEKLSGIMLKGLETTLTKDIFRLFIDRGLPDNWCPIVKMNNDNTPFVEFLVKSEISDQDPFSQLSEYSTEHMALCKFVVDHLHASAKCIRTTSALSHRQPPTMKNPKASHSMNAQVVPVAQIINKRSSLPIPMTCSTPISQRKSHPIAKRSSVEDPSSESKNASLNDSKRILPHRACKSGYLKYA